MSISNSHGRYSTSPLVASEMTSFTAGCSGHFPCVEPRFLPLCLVGSSELGIPGSVVLSESLPSLFFWHFLPSSLFWNLGFSLLCYMYPFVCLTNMLWSHSVPRMFSALAHSTEGGRAFQKRWPRRGLCWLCLTLGMSSHLPHAVVSSLGLPIMSFKGTALPFQHMANSRLLRGVSSNCRWGLEVDV